MSEEWGPWIEHDGGGCPCAFMYAQFVCERPITRHPHHYIRIDAYTCEGIVMKGGMGRRENSWNWRAGNKIIRYRIRKPRGMTVLEKIAANPEREKQLTE